MGVAVELAGTNRLMERVERIENVARTLEPGEAKEELLNIATEDLRTAEPVRPAVAAKILGLTEKTVRAWYREGVLTAAKKEPRLLLELERVHEVLHLIRDLRSAGKTTGLLDEVYRRLSDAHWRDNQDLVESLAQMRRGEGIPA